MPCTRTQINQALHREREKIKYLEEDVEEAAGVATRESKDLIDQKNISTDKKCKSYKSFLTKMMPLNSQNGSSEILSPLGSIFIEKQENL